MSRRERATVSFLLFAQIYDNVQTYGRADTQVRPYGIKLAVIYIHIQIFGRQIKLSAFLSLNSWQINVTVWYNIYAIQNLIETLGERRTVYLHVCFSTYKNLEKMQIPTVLKHILLENMASVKFV